MKEPCSMKSFRFTGHVQARIGAFLSIFLVVVASPYYSSPVVAASATSSGGRRAADAFRKAPVSKEIGVKAGERCFHDSFTSQYHKFRLREIPRSSVSPTCTFPGTPHWEERVDNPRCQSSPAVELVADGCQIEKFQPHRLLRLLHNRTLYLVGDSLTEQWGDSIEGCLLAAYKNKSRTWLEDPGVDGRRRAHLQHITNGRESGASWSSYSPDYRRIQEVPDELEGCQLYGFTCVEYSDGVHNTTICRLPQRLALYPLEKEFASCWKKMKETDIAVVDFGMHANTPEHIWAGLQNFVSFVKNSRSSGSEAKLPNLIWRESSPQHFQTPGGSYPYGNPEMDVHTKNLPCADISIEHAALNEFRNRIMLPVIQSAGIPVLPVWQLTATDSKYHPGSLHGRVGMNDCTHFCMSSGSVLDSWSTMLQNLLGGLTARCDGHTPFQECHTMTTATM